METKPPKKEALAPRSRQLEPLKATETGLIIAKSPVIGKSPRRPKLVDPWQEARINYLDGEVARLAAGPIARRFLKEAKARYSQYRWCDCPRLRYLCWSALDIVAGQLVGRSREQLSSQGFSTTEGKSDPKYGFR
jgi:hypothetical protein